MKPGGGGRRRRRRRRRCGDWDAPWSPAARSLWAGPETPPLPRPPPPPTWFQRCAQAGPAGGREGGRPGGARGEAVVERGVSVSECVCVCVRVRVCVCVCAGWGDGGGRGRLGGEGALSVATWLTRQRPDPSSAHRPRAAFLNSVAGAFILFQTT